MHINRKFVKPVPLYSPPLSVLWSLLLIVSAVQLTWSRPALGPNKRRETRSPPVYEDVQGYLTKFGYLPESDLETGNLRTEDQLRDALRTLQWFGNVPVTGQMDDATKELMQKPRCGIRDVIPSSQGRRSKRFALQGQKWHHVNLTWSLRTRHFDRMDHGWARSDLRKALQVWAKHSKLTFQEVNSETADILVFFEKGFHSDGYPFDGPGNVLAHAFFPGAGRGGDAHFDQEEEWLLNGKESPDGTSLFTVAAHEFGHSLGLSHSSVQGALMFPWYHGLKPDFELPDDDRFGIQILYGSKSDKIWGNITAYRPSSRRPETPTTTTMATTTVATTTTTTTAKSVATRTSMVVPSTTPKQPEVRRPSPVDALKPDYCNTSFDAVSIIRKETFFFKGKYIWRIGPKGLYLGYPALINRLWHNLPDDLEQVDAVYERQDGKIVFFIGRQYYVYHGNVPVPGYPKPLTSLGLPDQLDRVDAATVWGHNSKTYIFSGTMYWRYDDETGKMELDYPRDMSIWRGVGYNIDAAFQWHDGATYFFKNREFWKFNDLRMRVYREEPSPTGPFWFNCSSTHQPKYSPKKGLIGVKQQQDREFGPSSSASGNCLWPVTSFLLIALTSALRGL
ncbi:matrix metalloproteinase-2-like [Adelges cooleyi]|uniref:matrix metalloproteinase-2-like n=1 Tax=Adelges cooleyi TaxID=133065 RepID=UPI00217F90E3|nr:matrix metalloproteinase-2-like [Adelges cooleyi]